MMNRATLLCAALFTILTFTTTGCSRWAADRTVGAPPPVPERLLASLRDAAALGGGEQGLSHGPSDPFQRPLPHVLSDKIVKTRTHYTVRQIELLPTARLYNDQTLMVDLFVPAGASDDDPRPVVSVLPILGGGYSISEHFASLFARNGMIAAIIHRERRYKDIEHDVEQLNRMFEQLILDHEQAVDWLILQPGVDGNRIGVFGISAGAVQGSLVYAIDPRVRVAVLALGGGDLPYIFTYSAEKGIARRRDQILEKHGVTQQELLESLRAEFRYDPLTFAPYMDSRNALLILASFDQVVPYRTGKALREAMGNPETIVVPAGHYSAILFLPFMEHAASRFLRTRFAALEPVAQDR